MTMYYICKQKNHIHTHKKPFKSPVSFLSEPMCQTWKMNESKGFIIELTWICLLTSPQASDLASPHFSFLIATMGIKFSTSWGYMMIKWAALSIMPGVQQALNTLQTPLSLGQDLCEEKDHPRDGAGDGRSPVPHFQGSITRRYRSQPPDVLHHHPSLQCCVLPHLPGNLQSRPPLPHRCSVIWLPGEEYSCQ